MRTYITIDEVEGKRQRYGTDEGREKKIKEVY